MRLQELKARVASERVRRRPARRRRGAAAAADARASLGAARARPPRSSEPVLEPGRADRRSALPEPDAGRPRRRRGRPRSGRAAARPPPARQAGAQLVVLAAGRGELPRRRRRAARRPRRRPRRSGSASRSSSSRTPLRAAEVPGVGGQPVGEVDQRVRPARGQRAALGQARLGPQVAPRTSAVGAGRAALEHRQARRPTRRAAR